MNSLDRRLKTTNLLRPLGTLPIILALCTFCLGQSEQINASGGGRITGLITVNGKPAGGVAVFAYAVHTSDGGHSTSVDGGLNTPRAVTGSDGRYTFNDLPAGRYMVDPFNPTFAMPETNISTPNRAITVGTGELVEGVDFSMSTGGVITGRVMNADGRPAVDTLVMLKPLDQSGTPLNVTIETSDYTDDRGIYRMYGLATGRYAVCAQRDEDTSLHDPENVFYYNSNKDGPAIIAVSAGEEIDNIDITVGTRPASYEASGCAVDDSGNPVADANYYHVKLNDEGKGGSSEYSSTDRTDQNGRFRFQGLVNGHYQASLVLDNQSGLYGDQVEFEINGHDVSGIVIHAHTGASISGLAVLEGNQDPQVISQLPAIKPEIYALGPDSPLFSTRTISLGADGTFQASGFMPGTINVSLRTSQNPQGFSLLRLERDGIPITGGIPLSGGEQVTGLRAVLGYGAAVLRGQVTIQGGTLPAGTQMLVIAKMTTGRVTESAKVDARGRFVIEGLCDGQYQLAIQWYGPTGDVQQKQIITISGGQAPVTNLILDLGQN